MYHTLVDTCAPRRLRRGSTGRLLVGRAVPQTRDALIYKLQVMSGPERQLKQVKDAMTQRGYVEQAKGLWIRSY